MGVDSDGELVLLLGEQARTETSLEAEPKRGGRFCGVARFGDVVGLVHAYSPSEGFVNIIDRLSFQPAAVKDRAATARECKRASLK